MRSRAWPHDSLPPTPIAALLALIVGASNPTQQRMRIRFFQRWLPGAVLGGRPDGMQATTRQGKPVSFEVAADAVKVNGANVVVPDPEAI